ncbi:MAG TPA: BrnA antitoxin family protein [Pyrinomonadaceae bacterium]|jgi:uncharacterized protein (DUF4415 family)|nr:BrnA antitoxin family protein [Pyrinomonadaceae bacterium]
MKRKDEDIDDPLALSEAEFRKRFTRISVDELPEPIRKRREAARKKLKGRVTIYFDAEIIDRFKEKGKREGVGYQTLMNEALRTVVEREVNADLKEDMLKDKKFLKRLKSALSA